MNTFMEAARASFRQIPSAIAPGTKEWESTRDNFLTVDFLTNFLTLQGNAIQQLWRL